MTNLRQCAIAVIALVTIAAAPVPAVAEEPRGWQDCAAELDCSVEELDELSMSDRLDLVRAISAGPVARFLGDEIDHGRWRNIEGIITLFRNEAIGARGSWVSYVDAGIVDGVQRGVAIATGTHTDDGGNPGARPWADYLVWLRDGELTDRAAHDRAWSVAEQAATEHGQWVAEERYGEQPTAQEARFFQFSEVYRYLLRNRPPVLDTLTAVGRLATPQETEQRQHFYDWATDVTNAESGRTGAELLWSVAEVDAPNTTLNTVEVFRAYFREQLPQYVAAVDKPAAPAAPAGVGG